MFKMFIFSKSSSSRTFIFHVPGYVVCPLRWTHMDTWTHTFLFLFRDGACCRTTSMCVWCQGGVAAITAVDASIKARDGGGVHVGEWDDLDW